MVDFLVYELTQSLFRSYDTILIIFNRIDYVIVGDTTFYNIVAILKTPTLAAINDIIKPLHIVRSKYLVARAGKFSGPMLIILVSIQKGFAVPGTACNRLRPRLSLFAQLRHVKTLAKVYFGTTDLNQWILDHDI